MLYIEKYFAYTQRKDLFRHFIDERQVNSRMKAEILERYVDRVYAYALKKTFSEEEAADLSQEILFTAVKELPKLREEAKFEPWLWGIAANQARFFRRRQGKQRAMFSYNLPEEIAEDDFG